VKRCGFLGLILFLALLLSGGCHPCCRKTDAIYQTSTIDALLVGVYDGVTTVGTLKENGDFATGTLNGLDGEMIALDGEFYHVRADGVVLAIADSALTPFAATKFFSPDMTFLLSGSRDLDGLMSALDSRIPNRNLFYAIRIDGTFPYIRTRSIPAQHRPYPGLAEAARGQSVFEFRDIKGTLIGFRSPNFVKGLNLPGYHIHFISADRKSGGHLIGCRVDEAAVSLDEASEFRLSLPRDGDFAGSDLGKDRTEELDRAER
jgi:acetolactate decarboxylase